MDVEVKELPEMRLAYMRRLGAYGPEVGEVWDRFRRWALPRGLLRPDAVTLGVCHDNPEVTAPEHCRYDVGLVVDEDFRPDEHVNVQTVPGGSYAIYPFEGRAEEVGKAWHDLFAQWLPDSGYQPDDRPCFERCFETETADAEIFRMQICIPVRPL